MIILLLYAIIVIITFMFGSGLSSPKVGSAETVIPKDVESLPFVPCVPPIAGKLVNKHHGQRKLFVAELDLLTRHRPKYFVYAGSAPGIHLGRLMDMFPEITFVLIDPNEFTILMDGTIANYNSKDIVYLYSGTYDGYKLKVPKKVLGIDGKLHSRGEVPVPENYVDEISKGTYRAYIIEKLMTRELAKELRRLPGDIVFMSDIRTNSGDELPTNGDFLWNMAQMYVWVTEMNPIVFSHKHRPIIGSIEDGDIEDYMLEDIAAAKELGLDLLKEPNRYLHGDAYLQVWTSRHSPETRLVGVRADGKGDGRVGSSDETICGYMPISPDFMPAVKDEKMVGNYIISTYDSTEYDQKMLYHNRIDRSRDDYVHPALIGNGVDSCYDCAREAQVWDGYYRSVGIVPTARMIANDMRGLSGSLILDHTPRDDDLARLHTKVKKTDKSKNVNTSAKRLLSGGRHDHQEPYYDPAD